MAAWFNFETNMDTATPQTADPNYTPGQNTGQVNLIVVDIETSGLDLRRHSMLSLGAVDYATGKEYYDECSLGEGREWDQGALDINGFKLEDILPGKKQTPWHLLACFVEWSLQFPNSILAGHNPGHFDILWLEDVWENARFDKFPFSYRTLDLHTLAFAAFGESLKHSDICRRLGLEPEPKPHHALYGARSECAAIRALLCLWLPGFHRASIEKHPMFVINTGGRPFTVGDLLLPTDKS